MCDLRQALSRDHEAAMGRNVSLQQRLDALRTRNQQLKAKAVSHEKRLARARDVEAKLEKMTLEVRRPWW